VRDNPPEVFVAEDLETLNWVLALRLIARTASRDVAEELRARLRAAVRDEKWGEAVEIWMQVRPGEIDVYPSFDFFTERDVRLASEELQFTPLFRD
jgi:acyl-CoA synthetase (AMP-forming)/AMP-acid ligase II